MPGARANVDAFDKTHPTVSVVIPAKNEATNIPWVLEHLPETIHEVILVDGLSRDDTVAAAMSVRRDIVVVEERRPGKGAALRAGFERASGDTIVMIDADGSMAPEEIPGLIRSLEDGCDFAKGSRFTDGGFSEDITFIRRLGHSTLLWLVNRLYETQFTDLCYGLCAFRKTCLGRLALDADGFEIETQMVLGAVTAGLKVTEVPSVESPRRTGTSNLRTFRDGFRVLRMVIVQRWRRPSRSARQTVGVPEIRHVKCPKGKVAFAASRRTSPRQS